MCKFLIFISHVQLTQIHGFLESAPSEVGTPVAPGGTPVGLGGTPVSTVGTPGVHPQISSRCRVPGGVMIIARGVSIGLQTLIK